MRRARNASRCAGRGRGCGTGLSPAFATANATDCGPGGRGSRIRVCVLIPRSFYLTRMAAASLAIFAWRRRFSHRVDADYSPLDGQISLDDRDSAPFVLSSEVAGADYGRRVPKPNIPWRDTIIYEAHVRGLTKTLAAVPEELRGTYAGVAHPATIEHLQSLGVTAIELLPIQAQLPEVHLAQRGMRNYWGYNTVGFFAPEPWLATQAAQRRGASAILAEVKGMVDLLHAAGIEVILDVVYNHTAEGGTDGPTYSWRGLDPHSYYLHAPAKPGEFADVTGCGNTLDRKSTRLNSSHVASAYAVF